MTRIIITGASGFVGSNLTRELLQSNAEVAIFTRKQSNLWRLQDILSRLNVNVVDMGDIESLKRIVKKIEPDIVYHLATYGGYPFQQDFETIILNNILYSVNLMRVLENIGLERFVNIGSSSEYGVKSKPMRESDIAEPVIPYAIAKVAQTLFSKYFFNQYKLPTVTLRLFSVYGPYEEPGRLIYDVMIALIHNKVLKLSSPLPRRDFIHVDDVTEALQSAAKTKNVEGEVFNIGSGKDYSVGEVLKLASNISKTKLKVLWGANEKKRSFDTTTKWVADVRKADKLLKWRPKITLKEGLERTYHWYYDHNQLYDKIGAQNDKRRTR